MRILSRGVIGVGIWLCLFINTLAQSQLDTARQRFEAQLKQVDVEQTAPAEKKLMINAFSAMMKLSNELQAAGDFAGIKAVQAEMERLQKDERIRSADLVEAPAKLKGIQELFQKQKAGIAAESLLKKELFKKKYLAQVTAYQRKVTREGKFAIAEACDVEIKRVKALSLKPNEELAKQANRLAPAPAPAGAIASVKNWSEIPGHLGNGFFIFDKRVYRLMGHHPLSYDDALAKAKEYGAELACFETEDEYKQVKALIGWSTCWIGLQLRENSYGWKSSNRRLSYEAWAPLEPTESKEYRFGALLGNTRKNRQANQVGKICMLSSSITAGKATRLPWLAEWTSRTQALTAFTKIKKEQADIKGKGSTFKGKSYVVKKGLALDFAASVDYCRSLGATMSTPVDATELKFIHELYRSGNFFVGASDDATEGVWIDVFSGKPLSITAWGKGEPNNSGGEHVAAHRSQKHVLGAWWDINGLTKTNGLICRFPK